MPPWNVFLSHRLLIITLKLLILFVITNAYDISNGTHDLKILNIICKALERRQQVAI